MNRNKDIGLLVEWAAVESIPAATSSILDVATPSVFALELPSALPFRIADEGRKVGSMPRDFVSKAPGILYKMLYRTHFLVVE